MNAHDFLDLFAVIFITAAVAFGLVALWSILGGVIVYMIFMAIGGAAITYWSIGDDRN